MPASLNSTVSPPSDIFALIVFIVNFFAPLIPATFLWTNVFKPHNFHYSTWKRQKQISTLLSLGILISNFVMIAISAIHYYTNDDQGTTILVLIGIQSFLYRVISWFELDLVSNKYTQLRPDLVTNANNSCFWTKVSIIPFIVCEVVGKIGFVASGRTSDILFYVGEVGGLIVGEIVAMTWYFTKHSILKVFSVALNLIMIRRFISQSQFKLEGHQNKFRQIRRTKLKLYGIMTLLLLVGVSGGVCFIVYHVVKAIEFYILVGFIVTIYTVLEIQLVRYYLHVKNKLQNTKKGKKIKKEKPVTQLSSIYYDEGIEPETPLSTPLAHKNLSTPWGHRDFDAPAELRSPIIRFNLDKEMMFLPNREEIVAALIDEHLHMPDENKAPARDEPSTLTSHRVVEVVNVDVLINALLPKDGCNEIKDESSTLSRQKVKLALIDEDLPRREENKDEP